ARLDGLVRPLADGAYALDMRAFRCRGGRVLFHPRTHALVGPPRPPSATAGPANGTGPPLAELVRGCQHLLAHRNAPLPGQGRRRTAVERLCLGGSVLADPWLAAEVLARAPFAEVHLSPMLDESACAVGAAACAAARAGGARVDLQPRP